MRANKIRLSGNRARGNCCSKRCWPIWRVKAWAPKILHAPGTVKSVARYWSPNACLQQPMAVGMFRQRTAEKMFQAQRVELGSALALVILCKRDADAACSGLINVSQAGDSKSVQMRCLHKRICNTNSQQHRASHEAGFSHHLELLLREICPCSG